MSLFITPMILYFYILNAYQIISYPILLKAAEGSRSVYVAGIAFDAQTYGGVKDLDLIFHVEYL